MSNRSKSRGHASHKSGLPPGSLVHVGPVLVDETCISVIDYSKESVSESRVESIEQLLPYRDSETVTWVIVEGLARVEFIEQIGAMFGIHQLVLEDILNTHQRPKFEEYDDYLYIVLKGMMSVGEKFTVSYEQISLLVLEKVVFAFKEKKDGLFEPVIQRIRTSKGRFRSMGADFLTYSILDAIIDQNFILIDSLDESITALEDQLLAGEPSSATLNGIQRLKREIVGVRRYVSPIRELINEMLRSESKLIDERTHIYLRDVSDHAMRIIESIELHRDVISGLLDIYISSVSNKMNEVMKVLTVFASIFIPMTFLTGIYGMNFDYMPELKMHWAYPALWLVFLTIPTVLLVYFKRKKWL
ncbi:MAG: magnesium/cobalt transporter CorA [Halioglobus sp.]|nr:magnesium/cobalt transporter CorA [Halioglobus sp.]